ncbi:YdbT family protein [Jatrophihabitans fulvus]
MPDFLASEKVAPRYHAHQHWVMLVRRRPRRSSLITLAVLLLAAWIWPWPWAFVLVVVAALLGFLRWRLWASEQLWLTNKRIIHVHGVLETSRTEAWLRLERVSGMRVTESLLGSWLNYATIHVDAPGDHPGTHHLWRIGKALPFYRRFRSLVLEGNSVGDPDLDGSPGEYVTEELPSLPDAGVRYRHRDLP